MIEAERSKDELERLKALHSYEILDTKAEAAFDAITHLAARLCRTPVAVISLIDVERQWFKSTFGIEAIQTPRKISYCAYAIQNPDEVFLVPDALGDDRFKGHPSLATDAPLRSYAGAPIVNPDGYALGTLCVVDHTPRDFTEQEKEDLRALAAQIAVQLELRRHINHLRDEAEEKKKLAEASKEANRMKSSFLASMSHEIRSPLTGIMGFSEMLLDASLPEEHRIEAANVIVKSSQHLLSVVDDILDYSKIEAGKLEIEKILVSTKEILNDLEQFAAFKAGDKGINFKLERANNLPEAFLGDPTRIKQIIFNLLSNAIKFTENGGVTLKVSFEEGSLRFAVTDTGIGLTANQMERIFAPFEQAEMSTTRKFGGTGLGLSISLRLSNAMKGKIKVESEAGRGSTFSFELPLQDLPEEIPATVVDAYKAQTVSVAGKKVLLADDSPDNQELVKYFLSKEGIEVSCVNNGLEAIMAAKTESMDLILMDLHMPEVDGIEATSEIRKLGITTPIVALTASVTEEDREAFSRAGVNDSIRKPFQRAGLIECVVKYLLSDSMQEQVATMDESLFKIIQNFVNGLDARFEEIEKQFKQQNLSELAFSAHSLCSAGIFGFRQLGSSAAELERAVTSENGPALQSAFNNVKEQVEKCKIQDPRTWMLPL